MASSLDFVNFVSEQMGDAGDIRWRKMFGEYGIYCNGKIIGLVCDDRLFLKITEEVKAAYPDLVEAPPYKGAKNYFAIDDVDDRRKLGEMTALTYRSLPETAKKKPSKRARAKAETKAGNGSAAKTSADSDSKKPSGSTAKLDYKKVYKILYQPQTKPAIVDVPEMAFIQIQGAGDPNTSAAYQTAIEVLYGLSFTIKMSKMSGQQPDGYFEYVVPPLEGLWWMEDQDGRQAEPDFDHKERFHWISMIRQPEFVTEEVFQWAVKSLEAKKPELADALDQARFTVWQEGLCCQVMHKGSYDAEPATIAVMKDEIEAQGFTEDFESGRLHHEIYLSDPRRCKAENLKTVIRIPVKK